MPIHYNDSQIILKERSLLRQTPPFIIVFLIGLICTLISFSDQRYEGINWPVLAIGIILSVAGIFLLIKNFLEPLQDVFFNPHGITIQFRKTSTQYIISKEDLSVYLVLGHRKHGLGAIFDKIKYNRYVFGISNSEKTFYFHLEDYTRKFKEQHFFIQNIKNYYMKYYGISRGIERITSK